MANPLKPARGLSLVLLAAALAVPAAMSDNSPVPRVLNFEAPPAADASSSGAEQWKQAVARARAELAKLATTDADVQRDVREKVASLTEELRRLEEELKSNETTPPAPVVNETQSSSADEDHTTARKLLANHPFRPAVERAKRALAEMAKIKDYSAVTIRLERDKSGRLGEHNFMFAKIRHEPFSVYLNFLGPPAVKGREVIYYQGRNDGKIVVHEPHGLGSLAGALVGPLKFPPDGPIPMRGNRYPITEIGLLNLTKRLIEVGTADMQYEEADAKYYPNAKVNGRECEAWVFLHPVKRSYFRFHRAEVFIDKELNLPIRYASYSWPETEGGPPVLLEEYTYTQLKLNNGFTDEDFSQDNPKYGFVTK
jgi:hypothetical protein